jgi:GTPase SAR1 family protein
MESRKKEPRTRLMTVLLLGPPQVGKTKLFEKLKTDQYDDRHEQTNLRSTIINGLIGTYYSKTHLQLWDVPGESDLLPPNSGFAIICCEKTNANPKADLELYTGMARKYNPSLPIFVLQTKADLATESMAAKGIAEFIAATEENCYGLGEISAKNNHNFEIKSLFQEATRIFDRDREDNLTTFFEKRAEILSASWKPKLFTRSNIRYDSSWEELILDARHKKTSNANKAFLALGWLDENGDLTGTAPKAMIEANEAIRKLGMQFKPLK